MSRCTRALARARVASHLSGADLSGHNLGRPTDLTPTTTSVVMLSSFVRELVREVVCEMSLRERARTRVVHLFDSVMHSG